MSHPIYRADSSGNENGANGTNTNGSATNGIPNVSANGHSNGSVNGHANGSVTGNGNDASQHGSNGIALDFGSGAISKAGQRSGGEDYAPYTPDAPDESWNFARFKALLGRHKGLMAAVTGVVFGLSLLIAMMTPRVYRSTAQVIIRSSQGQSGSLDSDIPGLQNLLKGAGGGSQDTEIELLQSRPVQKVAREMLPGDLRKVGVDKLEVKPIGTTELVEVSTSSTDPRFCQQFSNALCTAYVAQAQEESTRQYKLSAEYVKQQLVTLKTKMDEASTSLRLYKEENGIADLELESGVRVDRLKELQTALEVARVEVAASQAQLANLKADAAAIPRIETAPSGLTLRPELTQLRSEVIALSNQRTDLLQEFTPQSPEVRALDGRIKELRAEIAAQPRTEVSSYSRTINPVRASIDQQIAQTSSKILADQSRIISLRPEIEAARRDVAAIPGREFRLGQLQLSLETYRDAFKTLNDRYVTLSISQSAPVANARLYDRAGLGQQIKPNLRNTLILGLIFGLIAAVNAALLVDRMDDHIHSEEDVRAATGLPILASIPKVANFDSQSLVEQLSASSGQNTTPLLESYRMLRTGLMFTTIDSSSRSIVLTSSQPNEGKSSVAANLARVLALNGKSVLLIDADLRRPSAHGIFNLKGETGFSSVAAGFCSLEDALQDTEIKGLRVLVGGQTPPNPPEMLDSRAGRAIFQAARGMADFVIIDAPPALLMADAQIIATEADGVLLVVSWEEALKNDVSRTTDMLARTGVKLLGVVVNKWDDRGVDYGRYYKIDSANALPEGKKVR